MLFHVVKKKKKEKLKSYRLQKKKIILYLFEGEMIEDLLGKSKERNKMLVELIKIITMQIYQRLSVYQT